MDIFRRNYIQCLSRAPFIPGKWILWCMKCYVCHLQVCNQPDLSQGAISPETSASWEANFWSSSPLTEKSLSCATPLSFPQVTWPIVSNSNIILHPLLSQCKLMGYNLFGPLCIKLGCNYTVWPLFWIDLEVAAILRGLISLLMSTQKHHHANSVTEAPVCL